VVKKGGKRGMGGEVAKRGGEGGKVERRWKRGEGRRWQRGMRGEEEVAKRGGG
jgi:hypothetical protein